MEKICPNCNNIVEPNDPKGDGIHFEWYCEECENLFCWDYVVGKE